MINLTPETRKRLKLLAVKHEMNYSDILEYLMDEYEKNQEEE